MEYSVDDANKQIIIRTVVMLVTAISAIIVFALLIFIHELGHFSVAKMVDIKVHEFAIGMGPLLAKFKKGETMYSIRALPIGGYVKMEGEEEASTDERAFRNRPLWARIAVIVAGAFMNLVLGFVIFIILTYMSGGIVEPVIGELMDNMPAQKAGLMPGDRIVKIDNTKINIQDDIRFYLMYSKDKPIKITVKRNGKILAPFEVTPEYSEESQAYMLGYKAQVVEPTLMNTLSNSFYETIFYSKIVLFSLGELITGRVGFNQMSGPVGIVKEIGTAASLGIAPLLMLAALISINLGVFNLLPIPALDGSKIFFLLVEGIRRKPIDPEKEGLVHMIGFAMLILLMILVTFSDITKLIGS